LKEKIQRYITYYNDHLAKVWKWSVVTTKQIQALIDKVRQIEGVFRPGTQEAEMVAHL